jgi:TonB family protein
MIRALLFGSAFLIALPGILAQTTEQSGAKLATPQVIITSLSAPVYPPVAAAAGIVGNVELRLHIRPDGRVDSAEFMSGHALLKEAALDSARRSQFECRRCASIVEFPLIYRFATVPRDSTKDCNLASRPPAPETQIDYSKHLVTVVAWQSWTGDPVVTSARTRSVKCLYLWKCGCVYFQ